MAREAGPVPRGLPGFFAPALALIGLAAACAHVPSKGGAAWGAGPFQIDVGLDGQAVLGQLSEASAVWRAGLRSGDKVRRVNGRAPSAEEVPARVEAAAGEWAFEVVRDGAPGLIHFRTVALREGYSGASFRAYALGPRAHRVVVTDPKAFATLLVERLQTVPLGEVTEHRSHPPRLQVQGVSATEQSVGVREGDLLHRINGRLVPNRAALVAAVGPWAEAGGELLVELRRGGELVELGFHLTPATGDPAGAAALDVLWCGLLSEAPRGVFVVRADLGSPYREVGFTPGILVTRAGQVRVREPGQLSLYGRSVAEARAIPYTIERGGYRLGLPAR